MPKQTPCDTHEIEPIKNDKCNELDASLAEELRGSLLFGYIPVVPLAFLGLGIYRAWIEIAFVGTFVPFPFNMATPRDLFDSITVLTVVLCAIFAKKLKTLVGRRSALTMTGILLTTSTVLSFSAFYAPNIATELGTMSGIVGGVGIAFMIVIWSEIYGSLNPFRVAAYYSLSIVAGALVIYVYEGFKFEWLFVMTALLPIVSLLCAHSALLHIPKSDRPARREATEFSIPWKAVFLMAAYAFAYGLLEMRSYSGGFGPHSSPGTLFAALAIFLGVCIRGKHFDFGLIYRGALPITVAAFLLLPAFNPFSESVSSFCISAGYTMQSILIMIIIASICYRYGASPHLALRHRARRPPDFHAARSRYKPGFRINRRCPRKHRGSYQYARGYFHRCRHDDFHVGKGAFEQLGCRPRHARDAINSHGRAANENTRRKEARARDARSDRRARV